MPDPLFVSPASFERQVAYLRRHYQVVSLGELLRQMEAGRSLTRRTVVLTFDDGYRNNYDAAFPVLRRFGCPATVFVASDAVAHQRSLWVTRLYFWFALATVRRLRLEVGGRVHEHEWATVVERKRAARRVLTSLLRVDRPARERALGELAAHLGVDASVDPFDRLPMLRWEQLREMARAGIAVGSHTVSHPALASLADEEVFWELAESRRVLQDGVGAPVTEVAYPFGGEKEIGPRAALLARKAGYDGACTMIPGANQTGGDRFALRRIAVQDVPLPVFALSLLSA
jgi:peptidoglycan/xylan/chitin deacetylase (PgdA/CDA1 family)